MVKYEVIQKTTGTVIGTFDNYEAAKNKLDEVGSDKHEIFFRTVNNTGEQERPTTSEDLISALQFIRQTCAGMEKCNNCPFAREAFERSFCMLTVGYPYSWFTDFKYSDVVDFFHKGDYIPKYGFCD
jgi:hypothetical protein